MTGQKTRVEPEPAAAPAFFGERLDLARRYADALAKEGEVRGLIGPLELPRLWSRHILNSALLAPLVHGRTADVGSGAGLPGIVLAIARPDVEFTLIEPMERRVEWLAEQREALGLGNVAIERARSDEVTGRRFDVVTARAVGALSKLIPLTAPLLVPDGELVLMKGAAVEAEVEAAAKVIAKKRLRDVRVELVGSGSGTEPTRVFRARVG